MRVNGEVVDGFFLKVDEDDRDKMLALMTRRYGQAHLRTTRSVQTRGGATFEPATHSWIGKKVQIVFHEMLNRVDQDVLSVDTVEALERRSLERYEKERAAESKI